MKTLHRTSSLFLAGTIAAVASTIGCDEPASTEAQGFTTAKLMAPIPMLEAVPSKEVTEQFGCVKWQFFQGKNGIFMTCFDANDKAISGISTDFVVGDDQAVVTSVRDGSGASEHHSFTVGRKRPSAKMPAASSNFNNLAISDLTRIDAILRARPSLSGASCGTSMTSVMLNAQTCMRMAEGTSKEMCLASARESRNVGQTCNGVANVGIQRRTVARVSSGITCNATRTLCINQAGRRTDAQGRLISTGTGTASANPNVFVGPNGQLFDRRSNQQARFDSAGRLISPSQNIQRFDPVTGAPIGQNVQQFDNEGKPIRSNNGKVVKTDADGNLVNASNQRTRPDGTVITDSDGKVTMGRLPGANATAVKPLAVEQAKLEPIGADAVKITVEKDATAGDITVDKSDRSCTANAGGVCNMGPVTYTTVAPNPQSQTVDPAKVNEAAKAAGAPAWTSWATDSQIPFDTKTLNPSNPFGDAKTAIDGAGSNPDPIEKPLIMKASATEDEGIGGSCGLMSASLHFTACSPVGTTPDEAVTKTSGSIANIVPDAENGAPLAEDETGATFGAPPVDNGDGIRRDPGTGEQIDRNNKEEESAATVEEAPVVKEPAPTNDGETDV